ncbi:MAG: large-conductance mechanosensitive channel protein MscL [Clostridia bacterium]|nr:large-conductance mechanosensitive channel protein MscL [Clostridia bacterium]
MGKIKATLNEFKEFISKGNIIDMAIGVVMGNSFKAIVTALVDNIIMPLVGLALGGKDFSSLSITYKEAVIEYGVFIQNIIDFLIVAVCLFVTLKIITTLGKLRKKKEEEEKKEEPPKKSDEVLLLEEIRDLMKEQKNG